MVASDGVDRFVGDRYQIVRELGRGGMGVVYLGRDLLRDMDVAIKVRGIPSPDATLWLKREFRAVASLRHTNLVELYELVASRGSCYFTMEYLPGIDPRRWVERTGDRVETATLAAVAGTDPTRPVTPPWTPPGAATERSPATSPTMPRHVREVEFGRVRAVLAQLAEGLSLLHARGVIHRDVKPSNTMVMDGGAVKLLDFGLALDRRRGDDVIARENRIVGTAAYLAPEYLERLAVSPAIDVYALGVLAFELVTGTTPFGGTLHVLSRLASRLALPRASSLNDRVPADLDRLIDAMLTADPVARPTALQVATELSGALSRPRAVRRPPRFVGRPAELARLARAIDDPTPRGRLVLVTGASGGGKTAVVDEAVRRIVDRETLIWRGRCHEREQVPYRAFDFIIDDLATELAADPRLATAVDHAAALGRVFPSLAAVIPADPDAPPAAEDLRVERERALIAMIRLFEHAMLSPGASEDAANRRGVVVVDDLQWADDDSLELLALLVERIGRPLTIVATWTTDGAIPEAVAALRTRLGAEADVIDIGAIPSEILAELIGELAPDAPRLRLHGAAQLAGGSPYLAELIGRELAAAGHAELERAEQRRLDRLSVPERAVAELAALAGGPSTFEQLRALAALPSAQLQSVLRALEDERVVRVAPSASGEPVYVFYHQRLRDAAHEAIASDARRTIHRKFAALFEAGHSPIDAAADQLAYHWQHAGEPLRAARWALRAAGAARAQLAWALAADWYGRALELIETPDAPDAPDLRPRDRDAVDDGPPIDATALRADRAEMLFVGGKLAAAAVEFERLARAADGDRWRVRAAESYIKLGEIDRGLAVIDDVLARRGQPRPHGRPASVVRALGVATRWLVPRPARAAEPVDDVLVAAYRVIASFLSTPYPVESFEYVLRGITLAERAGDRSAHGMGMAMLAAYIAAGSLGRFGDRAIARARALSDSVGTPYAAMVAAGSTGILMTLRGNWTAMRAAHQEADRICTRLGLERSWEASFLRTYAGLGEYYAGEPRRALEILGEVAERSDDLISRALLRSYRGRALVLAGELPAARALLVELERTPVARRGLASIYRQVFAGELALAELDWAHAEAIGELLARSARREWLTAMPAVSAMIDVVRVTADVGMAVAGDRRAALRARGRARSLYRRGRTSFYAATALRLWAQAERALGDRAAETAALERATAIASVRGGKLDRLAIAALGGLPIEPGPLASALVWCTGGAIVP